VAVVADEFGNAVRKTGMNEKEPNLFLRGTMPAAIFRSLVCRCRYSIFSLFIHQKWTSSRSPTSSAMAKGGDSRDLKDNEVGSARLFWLVVRSATAFMDPRTLGRLTASLRPPRCTP
jgi:hypothetical protein